MAGEHHGLGQVLRYEQVHREPRTPLPGRLWWAVVHRDDMTCQWCGARHWQAPYDHLQVDHMLPYSAGGLDNTPNLRVLCVRCNDTRSNYATWEWKRHLPIVAHCDGSTAEAAPQRATVYCMAHRRIESIPDSYAQAYELARMSGREVPPRPADHPEAHNGTGIVLNLPEMP